MRQRLILKFRPGLERLEGKQLPSAGPALSALVQHGLPRGQQVFEARTQPRPMFGFLAFRITQPNRFNNKLVPPFGHVLVQPRPPIPGQVYNVLLVTVRNGTARTFTASDGFQVEFPRQQVPTPILTGNEVWKPGQNFIFYVLTKKYYPMPNQVTNGFMFNLGGARSVAIPGPSGIFLRLRYNPATINGVLDQILTHGPGAEGGKGIPFGMPDTVLNEFVSAKTRRIDFGGYF